MSQKSLIIIFAILFIGSTVFLFDRNARELDPNQGKDWWTLSFVDPNIPTSDIVIDNHSNQTVFSVTIKDDTTTLSEQTVHIQKGDSKTLPTAVTSVTTGKISILVTTPGPNDKKEIYLYAK